jgi:hypothetical protein
VSGAWEPIEMDAQHFPLPQLQNFFGTLHAAVTAAQDTCVVRVCACVCVFVCLCVCVCVLYYILYIHYIFSGHYMPLPLPRKTRRIPMCSDAYVILMCARSCVCHARTFVCACECAARSPPLNCRHPLSCAAPRCRQMHPGLVDTRGAGPGA